MRCVMIKPFFGTLGLIQFEMCEKRPGSLVNC